MAFQLSALPFDLDSLAPYVSRETLSCHHQKHHRAYVDTTNKLIEGTRFTGASLEEIVRESHGSLFNNAAQAWNHTFYWHCMSSNPAEQRISRSLESALGDAFGGREKFLGELADSATENFGSGWTWLVRDEGGELSILNTSNADTPITSLFTPLLVVDVWEHAYYLDYRNARGKYLEAFTKIVNWKFASERFDSPEIFLATNEMRSRYAA